MSSKVSARITPDGCLDLVSQREVSLLLNKSQGDIYQLFRQSSLAVLNSGKESDDPEQMLTDYADFDIQVIEQARGIKLEVSNAPASAFVDGVMIKGIQEHLYSVLRDIVYANSVMTLDSQLNLGKSEDITNFIFNMLRNSGAMVPRRSPNIVVCWGGHSISNEEYEYTKEIGHSLGLRGLDICTGCGPGAMKGPMKGAAIAHAKQRIYDGRYIGITEPGIIAAESPNPLVNELVILPDIEKRLEAFVRLGHGIVVFPGGVGTAEEILYLLGVLVNHNNAALPFPIIFSGQKHNEEYFGQIDEFIGLTLGKSAQNRYKIIIDDPEKVGHLMKNSLKNVVKHRRSTRDAFYFNWLLDIAPEYQIPFIPNHKNMKTLEIDRDMPIHLLAANLRKAFSGIVAGNVKEEGIRQVTAHGPFELTGDRSLLRPLEALLNSFVKEGRMKLPGKQYQPCYRIV